jgi:hypothetical protein
MSRVGAPWRRSVCAALVAQPPPRRARDDSATEMVSGEVVAQRVDHDGGGETKGRSRLAVPVGRKLSSAQEGAGARRPASSPRLPSSASPRTAASRSRGPPPAPARTGWAARGGGMSSGGSPSPHPAHRTSRRSSSPSPFPRPAAPSAASGSGRWGWCSLAVGKVRPVHRLVNPVCSFGLAQRMNRS